MSKTRPSVNNSWDAYLPDNALFCIMCMLDLDSMMNLKLVYTGYQRSISSIFANGSFWKVYSECYLQLTPQQLEGVTNTSIKDLVFRRHLLPKQLPRDLKKCSYIYSGIPLFSKIEYYHIGKSGKNFNLKDIHPLLLKDDAEALFKQVSHLGQVIPFLKQDSFNKNLESELLALEFREKKNIIFGDLLFISLLPSIIKIRAINCFDLFIRAYLQLISIENKSPNVGSFKTLCQTVFSFADDFFSKQLIDLTLKICKVEHSFIYIMIKRACEHNYHDALTNSLQRVPSEAWDEIFNHCMQKSICVEFIKKVDIKKYNIFNLETALKKTLYFLHNNADIDINKLNAAQQKINLMFEDVKKSIENGNEDKKTHRLS